ncbi:glycosyltransferase family 2 protein [Reichenbachiella sp. MALMAid0571]|uniref:glycosyltransferase family 2 protein n=1 Tax=Reichenbachiella sp. MALMAid0571 TaxID=3143939 RepID=UPI0032DFAB29
MDFELTIVIPTKDRTNILRESLVQLVNATYHVSVEILVINDGGELSDLGINDLQIIPNEGRGVASARNTGVRNAQSSLILFMDDDIWLTKEAIDHILIFHKEHPNSVLNINWIYPESLAAALRSTSFGRYLQYHGFTSLKGWNQSSVWYEQSLFETHGITSQNLSIRKTTFNKVGGYNQQFPFAGFEDHEFSSRLRSNNIKIFIDSSVMTYHNECDRQEIGNWLERKYRSGITRKVGVEMGFSELEIHYSWHKKMILILILVFAPILKLMAVNHLTNRNKTLDPISFRIIGVLLAGSIYRGYSASYKK